LGPAGHRLALMGLVDIEGGWKAVAMTVQAVESGDLIVAVDDAVVTVTFNRPAKRNALTQAMYAAAADTLETADADPAVAAVVLTGSGVAFSAGNDLDDFASVADRDRQLSGGGLTAVGASSRPSRRSRCR